MISRSEFVVRLKPFLENRASFRAAAKRVDLGLSRLQHRVAAHVPAVIRPAPRKLTIAITADCNLRCQGCRYGRDFMPGHRLPLASVTEILDDARAGGFETVRFYGGEPLLHPDLPAMVAHATRLGLRSYVTTNGTHLGRRIGALHDAGLRLATIGFYGLEPHYTAHTGRRGHFERLERSLAAVRTHCGDGFGLQLNFVVMRGTANPRALAEAWGFAERFGMFLHLDLAGTTIPFFQGDGGDLMPREEDRPELERLAVELVALKRRHPDRVVHSLAFLRSVPDWMLKGTAMRVPCDAYEMVWIGADGTVQLCDTDFPLGDVRRTRLRDILFGEAHRRAARDAFRLNCPNCTCLVESRIQKDRASYRRYSVPRPGEAADV